MAKYFNTAGPQKPDIHYTVPSLERIDLAEVLALIEAQKYFVLHAPRQTGKTSCLLALAEYLNREARYRALYVNIEAAQAWRENVAAGMGTAVQAIASGARLHLGDAAAEAMAEEVLARTQPGTALMVFLQRWCGACPKPTVLMLDEADALVGDTLVSLLRQLRTGYADRPAHFPQSVILCGVRDTKDYRLGPASGKEVVAGGSAFNIKAESLRLGNFTRQDVAALYGQHTAATGQRFTGEAMAAVWELTEGQPWLVNALAHQAVQKMTENRDRSRLITDETMQQAAERLILSRATHLDQLTDKLQEERVRRVIEPLLANGDDLGQVPTDDLQYVEDLGLITTAPQVRIANKIYREVIPRELVWSKQVGIAHQTSWYVRPDGRLDMPKLLAAFQQFFREHGEHWIERFDYKEAGPQLLLQAFLQRIVNAGGRIEREYGLGRRRTDLLIIWSCGGGVQRVVIEVKVIASLGPGLVEEGLAQTGEYMDGVGAEEGHLLLFDRRAGRSWAERIYHRVERRPQGREIGVWGA